MTRFYLFRHAQTMGNVAGRFQGGLTDAPLSEEGYRQLEALAESCASLPITQIYTSPLLRTRETAKAVNRHLNVPITVEQRLLEIKCGAWEDLPIKELLAGYSEEWRTWKQKPWDFAAPGGESMREVYERVSALLTELSVAHAGENIALVGHGGMLLSVFAYFRGGMERPPEAGDQMPNASVSRVDVDDTGRAVIVYQGKVAPYTGLA